MNLLLILCVLLNFQMNDGYEYCKPKIEEKICRKMKHVFCNSSAFMMGTAEPTGTFVDFAPMTRKFVRIFLDTINTYRNTIASGEEKGEAANAKFPMAGRMRELLWENELAYMARQQASLLRLGTAYCSSSIKYSNVGINMAAKNLDYNKPLPSLMTETLDQWYNQKDKLASTETEIEKYMDGGGASKFLALVHDKCSKLGCSIAVAENCTVSGNLMPYCWYIYCFFDRAVERKKPVYLISKEAPGSDCNQWGAKTSKKYPNLCQNNGKNYPNISP